MTSHPGLNISLFNIILICKPSLILYNHISCPALVRCWVIFFVFALKSAHYIVAKTIYTCVYTDLFKTKLIDVSGIQVINLPPQQVGGQQLPMVNVGVILLFLFLQLIDYLKIAI